MAKKNIIIWLIILTFVGLAKADMPPDPSYTRVSINLIIETKEDVSDYRFYFDFAGDKKDVEIKSNGITNLPPIGGGARYSSGTLWAVSKNNPNQPAIELLKHQFSREVPTSQSGNVSDVIYQIERDNNTLKAIKISGDNQNPNKRKTMDINFYGIIKDFTPLFYILVGAVLLFTIALIIFGVRKFSQNRSNIK